MTSRLPFALAALAGLFASGCLGVHRPAPKPGLTFIGSRPVTLLCRLLDNVLIVETKWDKYGPYHFVMDTGSSVTLVSPDLARRYASDAQPGPSVPRVGCARPRADRRSSTPSR